MWNNIRDKIKNEIEEKLPREFHRKIQGKIQVLSGRKATKETLEEPVTAESELANSRNDVTAE